MDCTLKYAIEELRAAIKSVERGTPNACAKELFMPENAPRESYEAIATTMADRIELLLQSLYYAGVALTNAVCAAPPITNYFHLKSPALSDARATIDKTAMARSELCYEHDQSMGSLLVQNAPRRKATRDELQKKLLSTCCDVETMISDYRFRGFPLAAESSTSNHEPPSKSRRQREVAKRPARSKSAKRRARTEGTTFRHLETPTRTPTTRRSSSTPSLGDWCSRRRDALTSRRLRLQSTVFSIARTAPATCTASKASSLRIASSPTASIATTRAASSASPPLAPAPRPATGATTAGATFARGDSATPDLCGRIRISIKKGMSLRPAAAPAAPVGAPSASATGPRACTSCSARGRRRTRGRAQKRWPRKPPRRRISKPRWRRRY